MSRLVRTANAVLLRLLDSPAHGLAGNGLFGITYQGVRSRARRRLVVQGAGLSETDDGYPTWVVYPAHAENKTWWRNFVSGHDADVHVNGHPIRCVGRVVTVDDAIHTDALAAYRRRRPRAAVPDDAVLVIFVPGPPVVPPDVA